MARKSATKPAKSDDELLIRAVEDWSGLRSRSMCVAELFQRPATWW